MIPDDPICTCPDTAWHLQCWVAGTLVDEVLVDTSGPAAEQITEDVRDKHDMIVNLAIAGGQVWQVEISCPNCHKGLRVNSETGVEVLAG